MYYCGWILRVLDQKNEMQDQKGKNSLTWRALTNLGLKAWQGSQAMGKLSSRAALRNPEKGMANIK